MKNFFLRACLSFFALTFLLPVCSGAADLTTAQKRALLANVKRVAVVPPYFGVAARLGPEPDAKPRKEGNAPRQDDAQRQQQKRYADYLEKLEARAQQRLPVRLAARTPFALVPEPQMQDALKALNFTPQSLYLNNGRMRGTRFPPPNPEAIRKLAAQCQADAVLLVVLDEPRRSSGRILFDPLNGLQGDPPDVRSKAGFYLLLADGKEVLHAYVETLHPVTVGGGKKDYLLVDWTEAQDLVIEDFLDELTRYTPDLPPAPAMPPNSP